MTYGLKMWRAYKDPVFTFEEVILMLTMYSDDVIADLIINFNELYEMKKDVVILEGKDILGEDGHDFNL